MVFCHGVCIVRMTGLYNFICVIFLLHFSVEISISLHQDREPVGMLSFYGHAHGLLTCEGTVILPSSLPLTNLKQPVVSNPSGRENNGFPLCVWGGTGYNSSVFIVSYLLNLRHKLMLFHPLKRRAHGLFIEVSHRLFDDTSCYEPLSLS